eukprot:4988763-Prorocentrum_lima.AAC.1
MTSSLVGSEMCIRDRLETLGEKGYRYLLIMAGDTHRMLIPWVAPLKAVSYTHLTLPTICSV